MPRIVELHDETPAPLAALAGLIALAAGEELLLVGTYRVLPDGRLWALRRALSPRRMVALLVEDHVPAIERAVIRDLLNDGVIPVLLTSCDPPPAALTRWLEFEADPAPTHR